MGSALLLCILLAKNNALSFMSHNYLFKILIKTMQLENCHPCNGGWGLGGAHGRGQVRVHPPTQNATFPDNVVSCVGCSAAHGIRRTD